MTAKHIFASSRSKAGNLAYLNSRLKIIFAGTPHSARHSLHINDESTITDADSLKPLLANAVFSHIEALGILFHMG